MLMNRINGLLVVLTMALSTPAAQAASIDFDELAAGASVDTIGPISFASNTGLPLIVSSVFSTTSGQNYLGVNDGGLEVFLPGDIVTLSFSTPITRLSLNFIASPLSPGTAFSILGGGQTESSAPIPAVTLDDGGEVFPIELISDTPFSLAELRSISGGLFSYSIDDIAFTPVPLPPSLFLFSASVICGWLTAKRLQNANRS